VERRDVGEADERLRVRGDDLEVDERDRLRRAEPALETVDDVHLRVGEHRGEVGPAPGRVAGDVVVAVERPRRELDAVASRLPPLDAAQHVRAVDVGTGRRRDADRAAVGKRRREQGRLSHSPNR
jgi:hypothetical protein